MVTMMRSLRVKTATLSWRERFFTANEMLLATWCVAVVVGRHCHRRRVMIPRRNRRRRNACRSLFMSGADAT